MKLSTKVRKIIEYEGRYVEVEACPGAGKTALIVKCCEHDVRAGTPADQLLILGFSRATTEEIENRLADGWGTESVVVKTCHAFALEIVQRNYKLIGLAQPPTVANERTVRDALDATIAHRIAALRKKRVAAREAGHMKAAKRYAQTVDWLCRFLTSTPQQELLSALTLSRASGASFKRIATDPSFRWLKGYCKAARRLEQDLDKRLLDAGRVDFHQLLMHAIAILKAARKSGKHVRGLSATRLFVDEYQDTSAPQRRMISELARQGRRLLVVGDHRQAIFNWAGAAYEQLSAHLPGVKTFSLPRSHRLNQKSADFAAALSGDDCAITGRGKGRRPRLYEGTDPVGCVVAHVQGLIDDGAQPSYIAVLARHSATLLGFKRALLDAGFSVKQQGEEQPEALDHVMRVLKLSELVGKAVDVEAVIKAGKLLHQQSGIVVANLKTKLPPPTLEGRYRIAAKAYLAGLGGVRDHPHIRKRLGVFEPICRKFMTGRDMRDALRRMTQSAITLSTIHGAKGREWDHVIVVGVTDGLLPDRRATTPHKLQDERNTLFVAATRHRRSLLLVHTPHLIPRNRARAPSISSLIGFKARAAIKSTSSD